MSKTRRVSHRRAASGRNVARLVRAIEPQHIDTERAAIDQQAMMHYYQQLLKDAARAYGYKIITDELFAHNARWKYIRTKTGAGETRWICSVLHELGHAEMTMLRDKPHLKTHKLRWLLVNARYKPTAAYFKAFLRMEWGAWEQGWRIAQRLGLKIDETLYWTYAKRFYQTHVDNVRYNTLVDMEWHKVYLDGMKQVRREERKRYERRHGRAVNT